ncbi:trypsin-like peptidase domain-containing protein [bacterium]|nr:trypsin-like peptidase domain-containing protein [bacterium]
MPKIDFFTRAKKKRVFHFLVLAFLSGLLGGVVAVLLLFVPNSPLARYLSQNVSSPLVQETRKIKLEEESAVIEAYKKIAPSVVSIVALQEVTNFFGEEIVSRGGGTGFIVTSDGLILTNKHVVSNLNARYTVFLSSGKSYTAKVKSIDPFNDLAILKINASGLKAVELGDSDDLEIGQRVIAVGYALAEFENSVTLGIISGKERTVEAYGSSGGGEKLEGMLQTDAAINPGNSGGPLVNLAGQVVGINTAVASQAENIGFAIPINVAKKAIESVKKYGYIKRPMIGIRYVPITPQLAKANNLSADYGALIYSRDPRLFAVMPNSPAAKAGLKEGDIIIALGGEKIDASHSLRRLLQKYDPGQEVEITYIREGKEHKAKLVLDEMKQ